jgi:hypothetical protein
MKYKKLKLHLEQAQAWWDKQPQTYKNATKRPGGINQRVIVGTK